MHPYNFFEGFQDRFVYEPGLFLPPPRGNHSQRVSGRYLEDTQKSWAKSMESTARVTFVVTGLLRRASPLISGEAGVASAGLRHSYLRLGCERIRVEAVDPEAPGEALVPEGKSPHCYPLQGLVNTVDPACKVAAFPKPGGLGQGELA
jgi:hypothetical protein